MSAKAVLKDALRGALYRGGVLGGWHRWRNRRTLTVLMFHRVLPADDPAFPLAEREFTFTLDGFRRMLDFVLRHYNAVSLDTLQAARQRRSDLPSNPLLITFDDGWRDTLVHALPELTQRGLPAVLFLASEVVMLDAPRWWQDALVMALSRPGAATQLCKAAGWVRMPTGSVSQALTAYLGAMPESERRAWLQQHAPGVLEAVTERQMVTLTDLKSASDGMLLAIGGHGHTHTPLTLAADPMSELQASQNALNLLNQRVRSMSFPHGAWTHELVDQARMSEFEWIFTSEPKLIDVSQWPEPLPAIGRIHVPENEWTCKDGCIVPARLATFLFFRAVQRN